MTSILREGNHVHIEVGARASLRPVLIVGFKMSYSDSCACKILMKNNFDILGHVFEIKIISKV